ncbi:MAG: AAA family ATPase [Coriobacteriia bacterium]|nr:AAA family ATPase [Coriobacteriia bacterium]MDZ4654406.1 AAA family ATPase [Coriobacteriia bacterium]
MSFTFALAGKGGTGKTTTAALAVRVLGELGARAVLAVDADPNATLHEALGVQVERSVGEITEQMLASAEAGPGGMPAGIAKDAWLEYNIQRYVVEANGFDLLSMGRPEGAGCYCYANNLVRGCIDSLSRGYDFVVMDNEAGLEHLSRRTTRDVSALLIVSDPSVRGIRTAQRLDALASELKIGIGARYLVIDRSETPLDPVLREAAKATGLELLGVIPTDEAIARADLEGGSVFGLPERSPALVAVRDMITRAVPTLQSAPARFAQTPTRRQT